MAYTSSYASGQDVKWYLPKGIETFNSQIPSPESVLGFKTGERHITYDQVLIYMRRLAELSPRVQIIEQGYTYEKNPLIYLIISSPENLSNLESIRTEHLKIADPSQSGSLNFDRMPFINWLGYSVHGNEATGMNASVVVAYALAASEDNLVKDMLEKSVIIMQPSINPDGGQRYASWVNSNMSLAGNRDENSREFREPAPSSRSNHYWFDLNRDWLLAQHPESRSRLDLFYKWLPTMVNDYHEQGNANGTFFSPGIRNSTNPLIPDENWLLTKKISAYHSEILGEIGTMHFSKEDFDDFYTGKGSTLPDLSGAIGILYEQPNPRGVARERNGIVVTLADNVRNQAFNSFSALKAGLEMKSELMDYQRRFFAERKEAAKRDAVKGYIFGSPNDLSLSRELFRLLKAHDIKVYNLQKVVRINGMEFTPGTSWIVPAQQQQYSVIKTLFERNLNFKDTTFYDISAWTVPLAMNIRYAEVKEVAVPTGEEVTSEEVFENGKKGYSVALSTYAYFIETTDLYSYTLIYSLLNSGVIVKVADKPFSFRINGTERQFKRGTIMIPVSQQKFTPEQIHSVINKSLAVYRGAAISAFSASAGQSEGDTDPGSNHFRIISKPSVALLTGRGASFGTVGEIWHLFDSRLRIPVSLIDAESTVGLSRYNVIIIAGNTQLSGDFSKRLADWSREGGNTIISIGAAFRLLNEAGITSVKTVAEKRDTFKLANGTYQEFQEQRGASRVNGIILESDIDTTSPISYGIERESIPLFKNRDVVFAEPKNRFAVPLRYKEKPLLSGYLQKRYLDRFSGTPAVFTGRGVVIFTDDPSFRGYWHGSSRLLLNSVFYRELLPGISL
jgi:hypothetical protein